MDDKLVLLQAYLKTDPEMKAKFIASRSEDEPVVHFAGWQRSVDLN